MAVHLKSELQVLRSELRKDLEAALAKQMGEICARLAPNTLVASDVASGASAPPFEDPGYDKGVQNKKSNKMKKRLYANDEQKDDAKSMLLSPRRLSPDPPLSSSSQRLDSESRELALLNSDTEPQSINVVLQENARRRNSLRRSFTAQTPPNKAENAMQEFLLPIVESDAWSCLSMLFVVLQCGTLVADIHCQMKVVMGKEFDATGLDSGPAFCALIGPALTINLVLFTLEIAVKICAEQREFVLGPSKWWNLFDVFLWVVLICDRFAFTSRDLGLFRLGRLLRLVRLFEVFIELRAMLYSMYACMSSLCWAFMLLGVFTVSVSVFLEDVALTSMENGWLHDEVKKDLRENWNGMYDAMASCIYATSGGADWGYLARPFFNMHSTIPHFYGLLFAMYVIFTINGLMNILICVFVEKAQDITNVARDIALNRTLNRVNDNVVHMHELFDSIEKSNPQFITPQEIIKGLNSQRVRTRFHHLDVDILEPEVLAKMFDRNGNGVLEREEFVKGCQRLQGPAKPAEVAEILDLCRKMVNQRTQPLPSRGDASKDFQV